MYQRILFNQTYSTRKKHFKAISFQDDFFVFFNTIYNLLRICQVYSISLRCVTCKRGDFVLYFFLCFRSLRDRAPASDAGSGGSSPFGSIFLLQKSHCTLPRKLARARFRPSGGLACSDFIIRLFHITKATVPFFESTLPLGSDLAALSIKLRFTRFLQVPRSPNGFLRRVQWLFAYYTFLYFTSLLKSILILFF